MINKNLLEEKIKASGLKRSKISDVLGIHKDTLRNKIDNKSTFSFTEMFKMCELLNLTEDERDQIFLH